MFIASDPTATFRHEIPGQEDLEPARRVVLHCRYLTLRASMRFMELFRLYRTADDDKAAIGHLLEALGATVVRIEGMPEDAAPGVEGLVDVLTLEELVTLCLALPSRQRLSELDRKNSAPRQPGSQAPSAVDAPTGPAAATSGSRSSAPSATEAPPAASTAKAASTP